MNAYISDGLCIWLVMCFREIDQDGDGRVSFKDFLFLMKYSLSWSNHHDNTCALTAMTTHVLSLPWRPTLVFCSVVHLDSSKFMCIEDSFCKQYL